MAPSLLANKRTVIIGGGPVGLACARLLQQQGVAVTVYERDASVTARLTGGSLDLHPKTGQRTLRQAGLLAAFQAHARPVGLHLADRQGQLLFTMAPDKQKPEIERPALRQLLLDSLLPGTVAWNHQVVALNRQPDDSYELGFRHGQRVQADFVIIADGVRSATRSLVFNALPEDTGTYVVQGEIAHYAAACPGLHQLTGLANLAVVEDKKTLFTHQRRDGSVCLYASFRRSEPWLRDGGVPDPADAAATQQFLHRLFAGHAPVYHELFDATHTYGGFPIRVFAAEEIQRPHANLTLIGDAAHAMPPFGGMGVNMGLMDARILVENLTSGRFASLPAAVADYERQMLAYAAPVQQATHAADDRAHTQYANAVGRFKQAKLRQVGRGVQYLALLLGVVAGGGLWGHWLAAAGLVSQGGLGWRALAAAAGLLMAAAAGCLALAQGGRSAAFYGALAAASLLGLGGLGAGPWAPAAGAGELAGVAAGLVGLALFAAVALRPLARQEVG